MTRKERIERAAVAFITQGRDVDFAIIEAYQFIDAIDALPDTEPTTARVPDTTKAMFWESYPAKKPTYSGVFLIYMPHLNDPYPCLFCDYDADAESWVDVDDEQKVICWMDVKPPNQIDLPLNRQPEPVHAGEKVESKYPEKWVSRDGGLWTGAGGGSYHMDEPWSSLIAADANRNIDQAFRAGIEAAIGAFPDNSIRLEIIDKIRAIPVPKID
jgi:hypothetical protein